jgi:sterol desaturase/sphingolipid hydroxylase (fatty acid hydroxylase superfamily)
MLNITALFIPILLIAIGIEWFVTRKKNEPTYTIGNTMQNMSIGALDQIGSLFYFTALYFILDYSYQHFSLFHLSDSWIQWVLAFIVVDFLSYWYHRFSHRTHILWAGHITHHSSPHFNLSNGFRTSLFQGINRIIFWALLPIFGFSPWVLLVTLKVSGIYDFVQHTKWFPRIPWLERILITPSLHRVHHGKNEIYIDKNYGSVFSIWDRLFGTFQEETEPVEYGIKAEYRDSNPLIAVGFHYHYLWQHIQSASRIIDKFKMPFMPPEWIPTTTKQTNPVQKKVNINGNFNAQPILFEFVIAVIAFIALYAITPMLPAWTSAICYLIVLHYIIQNSRIINQDIAPPNFKKIIIINSMIAAVCFSCAVAWHQNIFWIPLFLSMYFSVKRLRSSENQKRTEFASFI